MCLEPVTLSGSNSVSDGRFQKAKSALFLLAIVLLALTFWYVKIWTNRPGGPTEATADLYRYYLPRSMYAADILEQGRLPLWDPYEFAGMPFLATLEIAPLYPTILLYMFLEPTTAHLAGGLLHLMLLALSMYFYLRLSLDLERLPSVLGSCLASFTALTLCTLPTAPDTYRSAAYIPLVLLLADRILRRPTPERVIALGGVLAMQFMAGEVELSARTGLLLVPYVLMRVAQRRREGMKPVVSTVSLVFAGLLALGLAAIQLLPFYEASLQSVRQPGDLTFPQAFGGGVAEPGRLLQMLFVDPDAGPYPVGIIAALLGIYAFRRRRADVIFFACVVAVVFELLRGDVSWVSWVFYHLPTGSWFRAPIRFLPFIHIPLAALAAIGLQALLDDLKSQDVKRRVVGAVGFLLVGGLALLGLQSAGILRGEAMSGAWVMAMALLAAPSVRGVRKTLTALAIVAIIGASFGHWALFNGQDYNVMRGFEPLGLLAQVEEPLLSSFKPGERVYVDASLLDGRRVVSFGLLTKAPCITGASPFMPRTFNRFIRRYRSDRWVANDDAIPDGCAPPAVIFSGGISLENGAQEALNMLSVRRVAAGLGNELYPLSQSDPAALPPTKELRPIARSEYVTVFDNTTCWPPAFVVGGAPATVEELRAAYVGNSVPATVVEYEPESIRIDLSPDARGTLVLTDQYYPGWVAYVDGKKTQVQSVGTLFRGVPVDGAREVVFRYRPVSFQVGAAVSAASVLGVIATLLFSRLRGQELESSPPA